MARTHEQFRRSEAAQNPWKDEDHPALEERFTLFFDFLGSSDAATNWPRERVHKLVDLLISIAHVRSAQAISGVERRFRTFAFKEGLTGR
jgi:hypothetical protein